MKLHPQVSKCHVILGSPNIANGLEGEDTTLEEDDNEDAASVSFPAPNFRDDGSELFVSHFRSLI